MSDTKKLSEQDLPFRKVRSKPQMQPCERDSLAKRAAKGLAGAVLTGDASGVVVGLVTDSVVDKLWPKKR
jgi:hypothetical protein